MNKREVNLLSPSPPHPRATSVTTTTTSNMASTTTAATSNGSPSSVSQAFCRALPKSELHAHLNGSIRLTTICELALALEQNNDTSSTILTQQEIERICCTSTERNLKQVFNIFGLIYKVVTSHAIVQRISREALEDMEEVRRAKFLSSDLHILPIY